MIFHDVRKIGMDIVLSHVLASITFDVSPCRSLLTTLPQSEKQYYIENSDEHVPSNNDLTTHICDVTRPP